MKRKRLTAAELEAQLEADPEYRAMREARDAHFRQLEEEYRVAQAPLLADLRTLGLELGSVWDLVNRGAPPYAHAVPTLVRHLHLAYPPAIRDGIARSLGVPEARPYWDELRNAFLNEKDSAARQGLACALSIVAGIDQLDELLRLTVDPTQGECRNFFIEKLMRSGKLGDGELLDRLRSDPEVQQEIQRLEKQKRRRRR